MIKKQLLQFGFTLMELMVVVAIIALLSAVILVSLDKARDRSENAEMIRQVHEYKNALQLTYVPNGNSFPWNGSSALQNNHRGCLADTTGSGCLYNGAGTPMYPSLAPLGQMIKIQPINPPVVDSQGHQFTSVLYASDGKNFWLDYPMIGEFTSNTECSVDGATIIAVGAPQFPGVTICRYASR